MTVDLLDRRLLFVTGKGGVGKTTIAAVARAARRPAGQAHPRRRGRRQGQPRRLLRDRPDLVQGARGRRPSLWAMSMDTEESLKEYLSLQLKIPLVARIGPLARTFDFVANAAPGVKEILTVGKFLLGGARAPLRPRRGRRRRHRPHRRPARGPAGDQRARAGRAGARPDRLDARHPRRPGADRRRSSWPRPRRCRSTRRSSSSTGCAAETVRRPRRRRRQPGPARAVRPGRGGDLRPAREPADDGALREAVGGPVEPLLDGAQLAVTLRRTRGAHLARLRDELPAGTPLLYVPYLFQRSHGARATHQVAEHLGEELGLLMARRSAAPPASTALDRAAAGRQGDRHPLRVRRRRQDDDGGGGGGHGRGAPRRQGAGAHRRPGQAPGQRARARGVRQRRDAGAADGVRRGRRRAPGRAVGGHARHQAELGRPRPPPRARRRRPATRSSPTRSTRTSPAASCRATTTSRWSGSTRSTRRAPTT